MQVVARDPPLFPLLSILERRCKRQASTRRPGNQGDVAVVLRPRSGRPTCAIYWRNGAFLLTLPRKLNAFNAISQSATHQAIHRQYAPSYTSGRS